MSLPKICGIYRDANPCVYSCLLVENYNNRNQTQFQLHHAEKSWWITVRLCGFKTVFMVAELSDPVTQGSTGEGSLLGSWAWSHSLLEVWI